MRIISWLIKVSIVAIASLAIWLLLSHNVPAWLRVETLQKAIEGKDFLVRVNITDSQTPVYIGVDLHGMSIKKEPAGFIKGAPPVKIDPINRTYEFKINIPPGVDAAYIFPVIILSERGTWGSRIKAAYTDEIPVRACTEMSSEKYEARRATEIGDDKNVSAPDNFFISVLTASAWIAAAALAYLSQKKTAPGVIIAAAILSSATEMIYYFLAIVNPFRVLVHNAGLYGSRRGPQMIVTVALIIIFAVFVMRLISSLKKDYKNILWIFIAFFWSVIILQILSLHEIDALFSMRIAGINYGQALRTASALLCAAFSVAVYKKHFKFLRLFSCIRKYLS